MLSQTEEEFQPTRKIIVPVDGSVQALNALKWTIKHIANPTSDQIVLINVRYFPYASLQSSPLLTDYQVVDEQHKKYSLSLLMDAVKVCEAHKLHSRAITLRGDARDELIIKINEIKPDLVVVGNRGLGKIAKAFIGSVSDYLVKHAECPVLVVR